VPNFVDEKVEAVILDVAKIDHCSLMASFTQMIRFCQNTRPGFLARNTPTPLISESLQRLDSAILESMCTKGTGGTHTDWTATQRSFANMKLQLPHHRGGYGITPCAGSAISAFYASTASLVRWLGHHSTRGNMGRFILCVSQQSTNNVLQYIHRLKMLKNPNFATNTG